MTQSLKALLEYVRSNRRVCPMPQRWNVRWEMLPDPVDRLGDVAQIEPVVLQRGSAGQTVSFTSSFFGATAR